MGYVRHLGHAARSKTNYRWLLVLEYAKFSVGEKWNNCPHPYRTVSIVRTKPERPPQNTPTRRDLRISRAGCQLYNSYNSSTNKIFGQQVLIATDKQTTLTLKSRASAFRTGVRCWDAAPTGKSVLCFSGDGWVASPTEWHQADALRCNKSQGPDVQLFWAICSDSSERHSVKLKRDYLSTM